MSEILASLQSVDPVVYYLGLGSALKLSLSYLSGRRREYVGKVTECFVYPLKSGHGVRVTQLDCGFQEGPHQGKLADRRWMVMNDKNQAVNYSTQPRLGSVVPGYEGDTFTFTASGFPKLTVDPKEVESKNKQVTISAYGVTVQGLDCGETAAKWFTDFLRTSGLRLIYAPEWFDSQRAVSTGNKKFAGWTKKAKDEDKIAYQSVTPYHILTQDSLDDLNTRLKSPVGVNRFRANIVIKADKPYSEDTWTAITIGDVKFSTIKLTGRCVFVNIDPATGVAANDTLNTLYSYRKLVDDPTFGPCLGIHMVLDSPGMVRVGDPVYVTRGDNTVLP